MPSLRKRINGFIKQLSVTPHEPLLTNGNYQDIDGPISLMTLPVPESPNSNATNSSSADDQHSFIYQYLTGRQKSVPKPDVYSDKAGLNLPCLRVESLDPEAFASYTGPDGGITQVPSLRKNPHSAASLLANLDDELNISVDCSDSVENEKSSSSGDALFGGQKSVELSDLLDCALSTVNSCSVPPSLSNSEWDLAACDHNLNLWNRAHRRAYGLSTTLYECHPLSHIYAGSPVADVFAISARRNSTVLILGDGVNWGERARLAARCGVKGAMESLLASLYDSERPIGTTMEIFHCLLQAFHCGHRLILQEAGLLTTLCAVVVCKLENSDQFVACACNVGDSLAFVYSKTHGVREITMASHDIQQMRDMRDAGGALGPVDGVNPELQNLTCSMTFLDAGDIVFITSDGISDNFDPVVGKFCVIKDDSLSSRRQGSTSNASSSSVSLNGNRSPHIGKRSAGEKSKSVSDDEEMTKVDVHLPEVEAHQRHALMLLRMEDLLNHGVTVGDQATQNARDLCHNLVNFAQQLTMAKRRTLEDPDLYEGDMQLAKHAQAARRKFIRQKISEMPGKLDHATVVAAVVGEYCPDDDQISVSEIGRERTPIPHSRSNTVTPILPRHYSDFKDETWGDVSSQSPMKIETVIDDPARGLGSMPETPRVDSSSVTFESILNYAVASTSSDNRNRDDTSHVTDVNGSQNTTDNLDYPICPSYPNANVGQTALMSDMLDRKVNVFSPPQGSLTPIPEDASQSSSKQDSLKMRSVSLTERTTAPSLKTDTQPFEKSRSEPPDTSRLAADINADVFYEDNSLLNMPASSYECAMAAAQVGTLPLESPKGTTRGFFREKLATWMPFKQERKSRKHERGSVKRHTLPVDLGLLRRLRKGSGQSDSVPQSARPHSDDSEAGPSKTGDRSPPRRVSLARLSGLQLPHWSPTKSLRKIRAFSVRDLRPSHHAHSHQNQNAAEKIDRFDKTPLDVKSPSRSLPCTSPIKELMPLRGSNKGGATPKREGQPQKMVHSKSDTEILSDKGQGQAAPLLAGPRPKLESVV